LRDKARYWSKIVIFFIPPCTRRPRYGSPRNTATPFGVGKLEWWGYPTVKTNFEDMYNRLDSIPECDRDGRTDRQTSCHGIVHSMPSAALWCIK